MGPAVPLSKIKQGLFGKRWVPTERHKDDPQEDKDGYIKTVPMGRWGKPDDVGWAVTYFASDEAAFVTGQTIAVNGGKTVW